MKKNSTNMLIASDEEDINVPGDNETKIKCKHLKHVAAGFAGMVKSVNLKVCEV